MCFFTPVASDYSTTSQEVTIPTGTIQQRMAIPIVGDNVLEAMEFFSVRVKVPARDAGVVLVDVDAATITITNDDSK